MSAGVRFPEFGCYTLPGHITDPRVAVQEIQDAEALGFGSIWISERFSGKNADVLSGAAAVLAPSIGIATGLLQNLPLRHPIVTAGFGHTMAKLSGNRFALGIGRGTEMFADVTGTPRITYQVFEDYIGIVRRLWRGETVNYEGPLGTIKGLRLGEALPVTPPIIIAATGDKTLAFAGRHADAVAFNALLTPEAVARSAVIVRRAAEEAGRDPKSVRIWTILVSALDVPEEKMLRYIVRRMNTYLLFPPMFDSICAGNGWDRQEAVCLRGALAEFDKAAGAGTMGDEATTRDLEQLRRMAALYPKNWIADGNAVGTAADGVKAVQQRLQAGADSILFHGSPPSELASTLTAWAAVRPAGLASHSVNPGLQAV